jgi:hypothetical protein
LVATADVDLTAARSGKPITVDVLVYSGGIITPSGGWGPTLIDLAGVELSASVPLLADHQAALAGILGTVQPSVRDGKLIASGTIIEATDAARTVVQLSRGGFEFQSSIGLHPSKVEFLDADETVHVNGRTHTAPTGGLTIVRAGTLREITLTAVAADSSTSAAIAASAKGLTMPDTSNTKPENLELLRAQVANKFIDEHPELREDFERLEASANDEDWAPDRLELELLRASRPATGGMSGRHTVRATSTAAAPGQLLEASVMLRAGREDLAVSALGEPTVEAARRMGVNSMMDLVRESLRASRIDPAGMSQDEMIRASFSTTSMPTVMSNVTGRVLVDEYQAFTSDVRKIATIKNAANFKPQRDVRAQAVENLEPVGPAGELKHTDLGEEATYNWSLETFARMLSVTRRDIINDDLGWADSLPRLLAQAAARSLLDTFYSVLLAGESAGFFSLANGNLLEAGSDLSVFALTDAIRSFREQRDSRGNNIAVRPECLIVPPSLEPTARVLLNSTEIVTLAAGIAPNGNPARGIVDNLIVDARLSNTDRFANASNLAWYVTGGPSSHAMLIGYLGGRTSPTVEIEQADFNKLGVQMRCYIDFGVARADHRAALKATGVPESTG